MTERRIVWQGSLDMASVERFVAQVQAEGAGAQVLVLDLSGMEFVDSTGIRSLLGLKQQVQAEGRSLVVEGLGQDILDILDMMGIRELIVE